MASFNLSSTPQSTTDTSGTLHDSGGPAIGFYDNDESGFTFLIQAGEPILLTKVFFDIEGGFDFLEIYKGTDDSGTALHTGSGFSNDDPMPASIVIPVGDVFFKFTSDGSVRREGFQIDWEPTVLTSTTTASPPTTIAPPTIGTLFGVTGDGALTSETLFTLSTSTGASTFFDTLGNGDDGEAIAFNSADGFIYHMSGNSTPIFEKINLNTKVVTNIPISGNLNLDEALAMVYDPILGKFFVSDINNDLYTINTIGIQKFIGAMDHKSKGLAFKAGVLYSVSPSPGSDTLRTIDKTTGSTLATITYSSPNRVNGMSFNSVDSKLYIIRRVSQFVRILATIDETTGIITDIGDTGDGFAGIAFIVPDTIVPPTTTPVPTTTSGYIAPYVTTPAPPIFIADPNLDNITFTTIDIQIVVNKDSTVYFMLFRTGELTNDPTSQQVKDAENPDDPEIPLPVGHFGNGFALEDVLTTLTAFNLRPARDYDVWVVAQNNPLQALPTLLTARTLGILFPFKFKVFKTETTTCFSKPEINLVHDDDGTLGKFGKIMTVVKNTDMVYVPVRLKHNEDFDFTTGGETTLDGIELLENDLVFLSNQLTSSENGIYQVTTGTWNFFTPVDADVFVDLGARAFDSVYGDLTRDIVIYKPDLDFSEVGFYTIRYFIVNADGICSKTLRKVRVVESEDASVVPVDTFKITQYDICANFDPDLTRKLP